MFKICPILVILSMCIHTVADAQRVINYKSTPYLAGFGSFANGKFAQSLQKSNANTQSFGGLFGLVSKLGTDVTFPVSVGGEVGIQGLGAGTVDNRTFVGEFRTSNTAYWLNAVARYRPMYWASVINPFLDLSVGPKVISTGVFEQFGPEEYTRIDGKTTVVLNTTVGGGIGIKLPSQEGTIQYLDIGVYYQQTGATKIVERNTVTLLPGNELIFRQQVSPLNNTQVRLGITWFR